MGMRMGRTAGRFRPPAPPRRASDAGVSPRPYRRADFIVVPVVLAIDLCVFSDLLRHADLPTIQWVAIISAGALEACLLILRYRAPVLVFSALWVLSVLAYLFLHNYYPVLPLLVALAAVAELCSTAVSLIALAMTMIPSALAVGGPVRAAAPEAVAAAVVTATVFYALLAGLAWSAGRWVGGNRRHSRTLQAEHHRLVQEQRERAEHAVLEERLRIARELHDIVAHSVTVMVLHAAGAKRIVTSDPARATEALSTIEEAGQQAMGELRRLLGVLRESDGPTAETGSSPLPGLAQLEPMIAAVGASGVVVTVRTSGQPQRLDPSIDLAAFRLIQEGLTNVTKHLGVGAAALVSIDWGAEKVTVTVQDNGAGRPQLPSTWSTGNGLAGLRERIGIAGGEFAAGPCAGGGFRVAARLPMAAANGMPVDGFGAAGVQPLVPSIPASVIDLGGDDPDGVIIGRDDPAGRPSLAGHEP